MPTITFPSLSVPGPAVDGYVQKSVPNVLASQFMNGRVFARRRFPVPRRRWELSYTMLTTSDKQALETFFIDTVAEGATPFEFIDPVAGSTFTVRFDPSAEPLEQSPLNDNHTRWRARFSLVEVA